MSDADYVLYVTGTHYHCEAFYIVAFAAACQLEDQYDRYILIITKHYSVYTPCPTGLNEVLY